jgi:phosphoribosylglycinamide formyltransferase 1
MKNIAVFASGNGTNFQAIIDAIHAGRLDARINLFVCDRPNAYSIKRAEENHFPSFVFQSKNYGSKEEYETEILHELNKQNIELIVLAGYMRLIGNVLLREFEGKIINIHPSLLPAFPGKDAIGQALRAETDVTGVTVHYVDEGMDTGPIIEQRKVMVEKTDTMESLQDKIHKVEHILYPEVLRKLCKD